MLDFLLVVGVLRFFFWILALGGGLAAGMFTGTVARAHLAYHGIINYERRDYYLSANIALFLPPNHNDAS